MILGAIDPQTGILACGIAIGAWALGYRVGKPFYSLTAGETALGRGNGMGNRLKT